MTHDLSPEMAKKAAEGAFSHYRERYGTYNPTLTWISDTKAEASFSAKGLTLSGQINLEPGALVFELQVPFLLRMFQGRAISIMENELAHWVEKAKSGSATSE